MTKAEMLIKIRVKTEEFNANKENERKETVGRIQSFVDKIKESLPKLRETHEILMALKDSIEWERFCDLFVSNTNKMDPFKDEDDGTIGMDTWESHFGFHYRYKEGDRGQTMVHLYIDFGKEEVCSCYDGWHTDIPINEVTIDTMFPRLESYHHQMLFKHLEKLVNEIDPYIEKVARFVESY